MPTIAKSQSGTRNLLHVLMICTLQCLLAASADFCLGQEDEQQEVAAEAEVTETEAESPADEPEKEVETARQAVTQAQSYAKALSTAFRASAKKALPSVVTILSRTKRPGETSVLDVIGGNDSQLFDSIGSGVIIEEDGLVLTNHHVVRDTARVDVRLPDGRQFQASEIKSDPLSDLAILKISSKNELQAASLGNSDVLEVGEWVLAIGSPFTLEASVSAGIISGVQRRQQLSKDVAGQFLQIDAAVNPGNSGGPLIDLDGNVIGINTAISSRTGSFNGIGFAIPINRAMWVKKELQKYDRVRRGYVGIGTDPVPYEVARQLNLPQSAGAFVSRVTPGYPGSKAGLKTGDVIIRLAGTQIFSNGDFAELVQTSEIGKPLKLTILREGEETDLELILTERPR